MVESLLIFSLTIESFKLYWCWCFVFAGFPRRFKLFFKASQPLISDSDGNLVKEEANNLRLRFTNGAHTFNGDCDVEAKRQKI